MKMGAKTCRKEAFQTDSGMRVQRWYLVEENGHEHLAVVGQERDTRDGHYNYEAEEPFMTHWPLHCFNQTQVQAWLDKLIVHPHGAQAASTRKRPPQQSPRSRTAGARILFNPFQPCPQRFRDLSILMSCTSRNTWLGVPCSTGPAMVLNTVKALVSLNL